MCVGLEGGVKNKGMGINGGAGRREVHHRPLRVEILGRRFPESKADGTDRRTCG